MDWRKNKGNKKLNPFNFSTDWFLSHNFTSLLCNIQGLFKKIIYLEKYFFLIKYNV